MNLLAIDTATETCSVALVCKGETRTREKTEPRGHGRLLLPWIAELLAEAGIGYKQLDALAVDRGPGGFTSLRIGLSVAQGIALAHDLPIHPVSSLAALAYKGRPEDFNGTLLAAFDARMGEVYAGWFEFNNEFPKPIGNEVLHAPHAIPQSKIEPDAAAGNAFCVYAEHLAEWRSKFSGPINLEAYPNADAVSALSKKVGPVDAATLQPVYLRDQVAGAAKK